METIFLNDYVQITKDTHIYQIEFKTPQYALVNSILKTRIIQGGSTNETYQHIYFKANSVKPLCQYLDENKLIHGKRSLLVSQVAKLIRTLCMQLQHLIATYSHTVLGYTQDAIVVINDEKFVFLGSELIAKIDDQTNLAMISSPFSSYDCFFSPEFFKINELPAFVHYKISYFSFALLVIYALLGNDEFYVEYIKHKDPNAILTSLIHHPIYQTKLYWLLSRCLVEDPKDRSIILV